MTPLSPNSVRTLLVGLAVAVPSLALQTQSLEASVQRRPAVAGSDTWKTDFSKHAVP